MKKQQKEPEKTLKSTVDYTIVPMTFTDFKAKYGEKEGLVMLGCGEPYGDWPKGVGEMLAEAGIANTPDPWEQEVVLLTTTGGRHDLVLFWKPKTVVIGKLAMWRLAVHDQIPASWVSDYLTNYADQHGEQPNRYAPEEPDEEES